jgi:putative ABC transport system permease protein
VWAHLRSTPLRSALSILSVAAGVALAVAVVTINHSAVREMAQSANVMSGRADVSLTTVDASLPEAVLAALIQSGSVQALSPVVEVSTGVAARTVGASDIRVRVLGVDALRVATVTPQWLQGLAMPGMSDFAGVSQADRLPQVWLNESAQRRLEAAKGDVLILKTARGEQRVRFDGTIDALSVPTPLIVADIAWVQEAFAKHGRLSRVDVRLRAGSGMESLPSPGALGAVGAHWSVPTDTESRAERMSRSYRINLGVLALVALATGAFLVLSSQALAITVRARELGLWGALGLTRAERVTVLTAGGLCVGVLGSALGMGLGLAIAAWVIRHLGGDLGAGLLSASQLTLPVGALILIAILGLAAGGVGAIAPALSLTRQPIAHLLSVRSTETTWMQRPRGLWAAIAAGVAVAALQLPPIAALPIGGYAAIALILTAAVLIMPSLRLAFLGLIRARSAVATLAVAQARHQSGALNASLAGIVISVALATSLMTMVHSFRSSLDAWLTQVLAAPVYVRLLRAEDQTVSSAQLQSLVNDHRVERSELMQYERLAFAKDRPAVLLIARSIDAVSTAALAIDSQARPSIDAGLGEIVGWVSESFASLYKVQVGTRMALPLATTTPQTNATTTTLVIAGVYRDYARQFGSITIDRADYVRLTGNLRVADVAIELKPRVDARQWANAMLASSPSGTLEFSFRDEIRRLSLDIFDRTFQVTDALKWVTLAIAVLGLASGLATLAHQRQRELGVLQHMGCDRALLRRLAALETLWVTGIGAGVGLVTGLCIGWILIEVVNRQSFHWGMDFAVSPVAIIVPALLTTLAGVVVAVLATQKALSGLPARAVRADA